MNGYLDGPPVAPYFPEPPQTAARAGEPRIPARAAHHPDQPPAEQVAAKLPELADLDGWVWSWVGPILLGERPARGGVDTLYVDPHGRHGACRWRRGELVQVHDCDLAECAALLR